MPAVSDTNEVHLDTIIIGGGGVGLWLLDELNRRGYATALIESGALGSGQTIASQGIIHGGLKYTLQGLLTSSADAIRDMPETWRACLAGSQEPDLRDVRLRAEFCHLWRTDSLASRVGMIGARVGLRVKPAVVEHADRPAVLAESMGTVARLEEQVISPASFIEVLAQRNRASLILAEIDASLVNQLTDGWQIDLPGSGGPPVFRLLANRIILTAGAGNAALRAAFGLQDESMQRRPLHMVLMRGRPDQLPELNGHCIDGRTTRVTITSDMDQAARRIWQVGGQISERGVDLVREQFIAHARSEITAVLPGFDPHGIEWSTYRVDRAEHRTSRGNRPEDVAILIDDDIITAWPTKLALVPRLVEGIMAKLTSPANFKPFDARGLGLPEPGIALPPWEEEEREWI